ncbi:protein ALTERED SEED GERMINATION 2-like [Phaseolus vulgaris]|uniref:protein ALTERED SEED GERMINATION 2-like n=1 Tax=Phaseolus vulgaris TaxID=3885 RepID=UPI0035C96E5F
MDSVPFLDDNIHAILDSESLHSEVKHTLQTHSFLVRKLSLDGKLEEVKHTLQTHSSLVRKLSLDGELEEVKHTLQTHSSLVRKLSLDGELEVRLFNLSRSSNTPYALLQCHSQRVKKLAVEDGTPTVVWSASEDGTLRQHDFREGSSCPPAVSSHQECRNIVLDLRGESKRSLADPPKQVLSLKSFDISSTRPHLLLVGGSDSFARLYDRRMLPSLSSCRKTMSLPPCVNYFCPMHLSDRGHSSIHLTHVTFSPDRHEVLLSYSGEHAICFCLFVQLEIWILKLRQYLFFFHYAAGVNEMQYASGDVSKDDDLLSNN